MDRDRLARTAFLYYNLQTRQFISLWSKCLETTGAQIYPPNCSFPLPILAGASNQDKPEKRHRLKSGLCLSLFVKCKKTREQQGRNILESTRRRCVGEQLGINLKEHARDRVLRYIRPMAPGSHFSRHLQPRQAREKAPVKIWDCVCSSNAKGTKGMHIFESTAQHVSAGTWETHDKKTYKESHFNRRLQPGQARGKARVKIMGFVLCVLFCCQWMSERASQAPLCDSKPCADEPPNPLDMNDEIFPRFQRAPPTRTSPRKGAI